MKKANSDNSQYKFTTQEILVELFSELSEVAQSKSDYIDKDILAYSCISYFVSMSLSISDTESHARRIIQSACDDGIKNYTEMRRNDPK